jgi:hypothetical protein
MPQLFLSYVKNLLKPPKADKLHMSLSFRLVFLFIILAELLSFTAYYIPFLEIVGFFIIILATLIFSLQKIENGLYFVLAELILGGKGYLFSLSFNNLKIVSLRLGIFIIVLAVWLGKVLKNHSLFINFLKQKEIKLWGLLGIAIVWAFLRGLKQNSFDNLFLDANGYFYGAMVLPFLWVAWTIKESEVNKLKQNFQIVFLAATTWLAFKTLISLYLFTHGNNNFIAANLFSFYRWIRESGVGEITWLPGNFARIFFQSHLYNLVAFFVLFIDFLNPKNGFSNFLFFNSRKKYHFVLLILNGAVMIVSLSRSFWIGVFIGLLVLIFYLTKTKSNFFLPDSSKIKIFVSSLLTIFILAILLLLIIVRFPFPRPSLVNLSTAATTRLEYEAAASSRWNLLPPLWQAIIKAPILGSGFGTTVTYFSNDPRIRQTSPTGLYTTYAFEWGWLDLWLKFGLIGLGTYLILLVWLLRQFLYLGKEESVFLAGFATLVSLSIIHFFTPYLNHPLGLGILILATFVISGYSRSMTDSHE